MQQVLGTARVWNVVVKEQRVYGGEAKIYTDVYISRESWEWWISNVDMWVGTGSAWHSKSLERRCQYVSGLLLYKVCIN